MDAATFHDISVLLLSFLDKNPGNRVTHREKIIDTQKQIFSNIDFISIIFLAILIYPLHSNNRQWEIYFHCFLVYPRSLDAVVY